MSTEKKVFIVGPGFIGWNIIDLLVPEGYSVTGLVRREEHAKGIEASGAKAVRGDLNDKSLIAEQAAQHDIVIHTATADHLPSAEAVLDGIKQRAAQGQPTIYIHTSGTSVLDDKADGLFKSDKVYHDDKPDEIDSVPDNAPHREIDLAIVKVQKELAGKAKIAIMIPPLIYGYNPKHDRLTIQIPTLTRFALKHGWVPQVGKGLSAESNVHVLDLARAYVVLLHQFEKTAASDASFKNPYYFCEATGSNEPNWNEVASVIGKGLEKAGRINDTEPRELPQDLYSELFGSVTSDVLGLNSRSRADRLRALGWQPREKDWRSSFLEDELPQILKEDCSSFSGYGGVVPKSSKS